MSRLPAVAALVFLAACSRSSAPTAPAPRQAEAPPVVEVQSVPVATAAEGAVARKAETPVAAKVESDPATIARRVDATRPVPTLLEATDQRIASMATDSAGAKSGQLWVMVDAEMPDGVADVAGAASFGRADMAEQGTWAVGCARLRADLIATAPVGAEDGYVSPSFEVVPGTLRIADSEAEARNLRHTELTCR